MPNKNKKNYKALALSVFLVVAFIIVQVLDFAVGVTATDTVNLTTTVLSSISLNCGGGATVAFGNLTPGTPLTGTTTCTTATNATSGYALAVKRNDADTTMDLASDAATNIADKTDWTSSSPNGVIWSGTGLGFRVKQTGTATGYDATWWGTDDTAPNAKFAGFPAAYDNIFVYASHSSSATDAVIEYKLDVPATQKAGAYDGVITYQVTSNP
ncbi:MAG: hypothetical protein WAV73_01755 [Candidatus Moraniibacteriota bacterium]